MIRIPQYLQHRDTIGIVCPAAYMPWEKVQTSINTFKDWGYQIRIGETLSSDSKNYFSSIDEERLNDIQRMLDDNEVKAIFCARGGYGIGRIIEQINFKKFEQNPKWVIGFSDVTVLHSHIYSNFKISTLHAPMASAFNDDGYKDAFVLSLKNALEGKKLKYQCPVHQFNKVGQAVGDLVGGNLSLLAHLIGSSSDIKTRGKILFLEDVGEYIYHIDRMFYQLKRSGKLDKLAGLIIGGFSDIKDTERPFGKTVYEIIRDIVEEYDYPVCFNFPVSHEKENYALKVGAGYKLKVGKKRVTLEE